MEGNKLWGPPEKIPEDHIICPENHLRIPLSPLFILERLTL